MAKSLINADIAPTTAEQRSWAWYHYVALWLGLVIAVPAYMLPAGFLEQGMSPAQAVAIVLLGNLVVLVPMVLIGHAGAKYGVPFPVLARASFGTIGARLPALARALVACGWYGIQTWIGGSALLTLLGVIVGRKLNGVPLPWLGIGFGQLAAFAVFWLAQLIFIEKGINAIRRFETWTAPLKVVVCITLVWWALAHAGGLGPIASQPSAFVAGGPKQGQFWTVFWPLFTAMAGYWGALALNIPDFTRFARSQRDQIIGQALGLPAPMALLALMSVVVTSATMVIYGKAIWDPVALSGNFAGIGVMIGLLIITIDTVSVNIAANLVGPAYDFSSLWPQGISYRIGGYITAGLAALIMPWKLLASTDGYIFVWLTGYGALLGPIAGIMIADYWVVRRTHLDVNSLYDAQGEFGYRGGWNPVALIAFAVPVALNLPGFLHSALPMMFAGVSSFWTELYKYAWFVGVLLALLIYAGLTRRVRA
ncbi:NCS1 family nucleobase:cation symporter-1 [Sphingomonas sp. AR_OL41]|uniref:NCS1 family nucleobase:cation symporter-1 n=1 Tax=Sphingomonas sp. AR_OL41 TaxID=3042729 RepID=UPI002480750B|nr:NCS1 family nucleobase:cation symporter-1 [Sphingomonas sp. AR_OL41]MDH7973214.1 NCS1 family nucleobase:cation symporter-1 [Sphingomonas sp. AR_OL41]